MHESNWSICIEVSVMTINKIRATKPAGMAEWKAHSLVDLAAQD